MIPTKEASQHDMRMGARIATNKTRIAGQKSTNLRTRASLIGTKKGGTIVMSNMDRDITMSGIDGTSDGATAMTTTGTGVTIGMMMNGIEDTGMMDTIRVSDGKMIAMEHVKNRRRVRTRETANPRAREKKGEKGSRKGDTGKQDYRAYKGKDRDDRDSWGQRYDPYPNSNHHGGSYDKKGGKKGEPRTFGDFASDRRSDTTSGSSYYWNFDGYDRGVDGDRKRSSYAHGRERDWDTGKRARDWEHEEPMSRPGDSLMQFDVYLDRLAHEMNTGNHHEQWQKVMKTARRIGEIHDYDSSSPHARRLIEVACDLMPSGARERNVEMWLSRIERLGTVRVARDLEEYVQRNL